MRTTTTVEFAHAAYQRYLRHCSIYKVAALDFCDWLVTA